MAALKVLGDQVVDEVGLAAAGRTDHQGVRFERLRRNRDERLSDAPARALPTLPDPDPLRGDRVRLILRMPSVRPHAQEVSSKRMRQDGEERDYLVGTQLEVDPKGFIQVVKEAFLLEHGVSQNQDIAVILGVDKSRVTQIFRDVKNLKPETVRSLLGCLEKKAHRRRILKAWTREAFGEEIGEPRIDGLTRNRITEKTLYRIDSMIRQSRMYLAATLAAEVAEKASDFVIKEQALDRLNWCRQRLDEPGQAMAAAKEIVERARDRDDPLREAAGHIFRARALLGLADCLPHEIEPILDTAESLTFRTAFPTQLPKYAIASPKRVATFRQNSKLLFMERGSVPLEDAFLESALKVALAEAERGKTYQGKYHAWQVASRIYSLRGQHFQAAEAIDRAFEAGSVKNLNAYEMSGLLMGRFQRQSEGPEEAAAYFVQVAKNCRETEDRYHLRLVEWELARVLSATI